MGAAPSGRARKCPILIHSRCGFFHTRRMRGLIIFVVSFCILLLCLDRPARLIFDEKFYVPAALGILDRGHDENYQHPPLAKQLVALSIAIVGDTPWGWRLASVAMGALALVALYQLAILGMSSYYAMIAVVLVFTNGLFFTLSRLALLEMFTLSFTLLALAAWLRRFYGAFAKGPSSRGVTALIVPGILFGLALAAKWSALVPLGLCIVGGLYLRKYKLAQWLVFILSVGVFYLAPFMILATGDLPVWTLHQAMWNFHNPEVYQTGIMENTSAWWQWALNYEPMWFAVLPNAQQEPGKFIGVMIFGNPFVIWAGWLGLLVCVWASLKNRRRLSEVLHWVPGLALAPWLVWSVVQRPVTYYYYFLPTSVFLALALVAAVVWLVQEKILSNKKAQIFLGFWALISLTYFFYHWPLMTGVEMSAAEFSQWYPHYIWR